MSRRTETGTPLPGSAMRSSLEAICRYGTSYCSTERFGYIGRQFLGKTVNLKQKAQTSQASRTVADQEMVLYFVLDKVIENVREFVHGIFQGGIIFDEVVG